MSSQCEAVKIPSCKDGCNKERCNVADYNEVVVCFIKNHHNRSKEWFTYFENISFPKVFDCTTQFGKIDHPQHIGKKSLEEFFKKLSTKEAVLKKCDSFEKLILAVKEEKETGIGPLTIYDTTLRIGANLKIYPDKVYLHSGTKEGANVIGLGYRKKTLSKEEFKNQLAPFQRLEPYEIEDCLCICKDTVSRIAQNRIK